jgi:hypothetical protein
MPKLWFDPYAVDGGADRVMLVILLTSHLPWTHRWHALSPHLLVHPQEPRSSGRSFATCIKSAPSMPTSKRIAGDFLGMSGGKRPKGRHCFQCRPLRIEH